VGDNSHLVPSVRSLHRSPHGERGSRAGRKQEVLLIWHNFKALDPNLAIDKRRRIKRGELRLLDRVWSNERHDRKVIHGEGNSPSDG